MIQHIEAQFSCDDCGTEFAVSLDPSWTLPSGWSLFDISEDAIRRGLSYGDAAEYVVGRDSATGAVTEDNRHLCRRCAGKVEQVVSQSPAYFIDQQGRLWKGPIRVDNFNYSRCHGIGSNGREAWLIWIAERSDPDKAWIRLPSDPTQACVTI